MKTYFTAMLLPGLFLTLNAFAQSTNPTLGGTVMDANEASLPGVTITATNAGTGIVTTVVTNDAGSYHFAGIQPGTYEIKADLPGFQTTIAKNLQLGSAQQVRLNFTLRLGAAGATVEDNADAGTLLTTSAPSITAVLNESSLRDLPLAVRDVFGAVAATGGVGPKDGQGMLITWRAAAKVR